MVSTVSRKSRVTNTRWRRYRGPRLLSSIFPARLLRNRTCRIVLIHTGATVNQLRIGLVQCRQTDSFSANESTIFNFLEKAASANVRIVCFPETQTVGYRVDIATPELQIEPERLDDLHRRVAERCGELGLACILGTETLLFFSIAIFTSKQEMNDPG